MNEKCFKPLYGFCTCLDEDLERDDCALGVSLKYRAKLCQELGTGFYTYLVLFDGFCHEVVRVEQQGGILFINRGEECTDKQKWPCGTSVKFDWTRSGIADLEKPSEPEEECPEETFTGEIKSGNCTVVFKNGVAIEDKPNKYQIPDGCYTNPVATYEDGCLVQIGTTVRSTLYQSTCSKDCTKDNCTC